MSLEPFIVFGIIVLKTLDATHDQIIPSNIDNVPSLLFAIFREQIFLNAFEKG